MIDEDQAVESLVTPEETGQGAAQSSAKLLAGIARRKAMSRRIALRGKGEWRLKTVEK